MSVSHPSQAEVDAARDDPKLANVLYHDWESVSYDEKWSISFDERCTTFAVDRFRAVSPGEATYDHALELGCGTGFFLLNLMQGWIARVGPLTNCVAHACARL